ncbi:MAG: chromosomal replication initiator protein DnaA [Tannerella sp.]|jgi:chromosomal replication initiator protein|nr:chromosomal replication initiator protein DnaA [Tannerella sp.]
MQLDYKSLWSECLTVIKGVVSETTYETWFRPIIPISYQDKKITVQVPSQFFYEYLEEKYIHILHMSLERVFGMGTSLSYRVVVGNQTGLPVTDGHIEKNGKQTVNISMTPFTQIAPQELDSQLVSRYTFDNFFEGTSNNLARSTGLSIAEKPGKTAFNPLFIYGDTGVGKTHLCHAIGLCTRELHPEKRVLYVSSHLFRVQFTDAVRKNTTNDFLTFYQSLDVLIMDDIQEFIGMDKTQHIFFQIFNNLHQLGKQIVLTSDKPPVALQGIEARLITRLKWGLTAKIERPDYELRKQILRHLIEEENIDIDSNVFDYIVEHVTENVRDLEGVLISVSANSRINKKKIDMSLVQEVISQMVMIENHQISIEKITKLVCEHFNMDESQIQTSSRKREIVLARQICMYLTKKYTDHSLAYIGRKIGGKDHATVLHSINAIKNQMETDKSFNAMIESIERKSKSKI